ncbi:hypothetical protein FRB97_008170 [Tulasnella sp. 331]|nr:hypothetical protein FRB97_008170 [Tulasnella sp. 331]
MDQDEVPDQFLGAAQLEQAEFPNQENQVLMVTLHNLNNMLLSISNQQNNLTQQVTTQPAPTIKVPNPTPFNGKAKHTGLASTYTSTFLEIIAYLDLTDKSKQQKFKDGLKADVLYTMISTGDRFMNLDALMKKVIQINNSLFEYRPCHCSTPGPASPHPANPGPQTKTLHPDKKTTMPIAWILMQLESGEN